MDATDGPAVSPADFEVGYFRCPACRREQGAGLDHLLDHIRGGWPRCCGQPMHLIPDETN